MKPLYKRIGITARSDLEGRDDVVSRVVQILHACSVERILVDAKRCDASAVFDGGTFASTRELDLLVVLGGDGTILRAIREMEGAYVPILSVHRGRVGFLAETSLQEAETLLPQLLCESGEVDERHLLYVEARRGGEVLWKGHVLNEAVISQGAISRLIDLKTTVNGEALTTFHADGVIVSSPTGSTAYSLSAGGPIVHPSLPSMILTPINPHSFSQKPIVVPSSFVVTTEVMTRGAKYGDLHVSLTLDGQTYVSLESGDTVRVSCDGATVKFIRRKQDTFFHTLREKLKWGERLED